MLGLKLINISKGRGGGSLGSLSTKYSQAISRLSIDQILSGHQQAQYWPNPPGHQQAQYRPYPPGHLQAQYQPNPLEAFSLSTRKVQNLYCFPLGITSTTCTLSTWKNNGNNTNRIEMIETYDLTISTKNIMLGNDFVFHDKVCQLPALSWYIKKEIGNIFVLFLKNKIILSYVNWDEPLWSYEVCLNFYLYYDTAIDFAGISIEHVLFLHSSLVTCYHGTNACQLLTHLPLVWHICITELGQHWFR